MDATTPRLGRPPRPSAMTPEELTAAGELLYGFRWATDLAEALKLGDSARIRAFLRGDRPVPAGIRDEIIALLRGRSAAMKELADKLERDWL